MTTESSAIVAGGPAFRGRDDRVEPTTGNSSIAGMLPAFLGVLVFSFTAPMTKLLLGGASVLFASCGRAALAGIVAAAILRLSRAPTPQGRVRRHVLIATTGVVFGFPMLTAWGLQSVPSSHGAVVIALLPLATAGIGVRMAGERPSRTYWLCSGVGAAAVVVFVVSEGGGTLRWGDVLLAGSVLAAGLGYAHGAVASRSIPGWQVICWAVTISLPLTIPLTLVGLAGAGPPDTATQWAAFAYTAIGSNLLGFFVWYRGLARAGIARASQVQLIQPMLSLLWAWPLLGERITPVAIAASVVIVGVVAVGRSIPVEPRRDPRAGP